MAKRYIVANWKSNKTIPEANVWLQGISNIKFQMSRPEDDQPLAEDNQEKEVIACPPFTLLAEMKRKIDELQLPLKLGAQDISPFEQGAYTGEIAATQIKEFADYVIVGHSERRQNFGETDELLAKKVEQAIKAGLTVVYCVQGNDTLIPEGVEIVAYEPVFAIGSGTPDTPENAEAVALSIKQTRNIPVVLYGGSVTPENINSFITQQSIDGVLVGGASLAHDSFMSLMQNA